MPKRSNGAADLLTIGLFAPVVVASRLQMLALNSLHPSANARKEAVRMTAEKPVAMMESMLAAQRSLVEDGVAAWRTAALATTGFALAAPAAALTAAAVPIRRRVRANARRLTGA